MTDLLVSLKSLWHSFGTKPVLRGLDLEVRAGEVHALLGENGSGKTTTIDVALGFLDPDGGAAQVLGTPSLALDGPVRERIGYVREGHPLLGWMRVRDVLDFEAGTRARFHRRRVEERVAALGLDLRQQVSTLSRGQRAQLSLALALAGEPELLVLDDPALGLDARHRRELLDAMIDLFAERGCGVLLTSHLLQEVERVADRVSILSLGRVTFTATVDAVRANAEKRRVEVTGGARPPRVGEGGVLAARRVEGAWEVLLWNEGGALALPAGWNASEPARVDLEELFLDVTKGSTTEVTA